MPEGLDLAAIEARAGIFTDHARDDVSALCAEVRRLRVLAELRAGYEANAQQARDAVREMAPDISCAANPLGPRIAELECQLADQITEYYRLRTGMAGWNAQQREWEKAMRAEMDDRDHWKDEYENLVTVANSLEAERDAARADLRECAEALDNLCLSLNLNHATKNRCGESLLVSYKSACAALARPRVRAPEGKCQSA